MGPCTVNVRQLTVDSQCRGTTVICCVADLRCCLLCLLSTSSTVMTEVSHHYSTSCLLDSSEAELKHVCLPRNVTTTTTAAATTTTTTTSHQTTVRAQTNSSSTHIGNDVVRCRADDDLLPDDEPSLTFDPAVLLLADRTLLYTQHSHINNYRLNACTQVWHAFSRDLTVLPAHPAFIR